MMNAETLKIHRSFTPEPCPCHNRILIASPQPGRRLLRGGDGLADGLAALPRVQAASLDLWGLLDDLGTLGEDELDVGGV